MACMCSSFPVLEHRSALARCAASTGFGRADGTQDRGPTRTSPLAGDGTSVGRPTQVMPGDERGRLGASLEVELREDRAHVVLHRLVRQEDVRGDLLV